MRDLKVFSGEAHTQRRITSTRSSRERSERRPLYAGRDDARRVVGHLGDNSDVVTLRGQVAAHLPGAGLGRADFGGEVLGEVEDAHGE